MPHTPALSYCGEQVRRHDNDRFLASLFAPGDRREALFALYAFNLEVAKTREVVTEPMLGQIRLQWWRDAVAEIYGGRPRRHEVIQPLAEAVGRCGLTRSHLDRVIDGREADLTDTAPPTLDALIAYTEDTYVPLVHAALEILGVRDGPAHRAARPAGVAAALTGLLRAVPFHARMRLVRLPTEVVEAVAVELGALFERKPHAGLAKAVERLAGVARDHLRQARSLARGVPRAALPALLPATLAGMHLTTLARARYDVFDPRVQMGHPWRQARLALRALVGRY